VSNREVSSGRQGIDVGLIAKIAAHSNAIVTLGHYTQAVRGVHDVLVTLERAYTTSPLAEHKGEIL